MAKFFSTIFVLSVCLLVMFGTMVRVSGEDNSMPSYLTPEEMSLYQKLYEVPVKRQFCRHSGFIYNPVTRKCKASLSFLRGRGRSY